MGGLGGCNPPNPPLPLVRLCESYKREWVEGCMIEIKQEKKEKLGTLFEAYKWNYLVDAVLEDAVISRALADNKVDPQVAVLELSKIKLYNTGGDANHPAARSFLKGLRGFAALVPSSDGWATLIQDEFSGKIVSLPRYAFTSERLDTAHLLELSAKMPEGCRMVPLDLHLSRCLAGERSEFASDHLLNYESPEDFVARGFGFCILDGEEIISVATTFVTCKAGIEIQINTREVHKRAGLATAVAARIMLHSLEWGLDPNWDAANQNSVGLATKLGYTPQGTYTMYVIPGSVG